MKIRLILFGLFIITVANSCTKKITACIDGPLEVEENTSATFSWCGENADNIEWSLNGLVLGTGNSYTPTFPTKGNYTIIAKGYNKKYEKSATCNVTYGRFARTTCNVTDKCSSNNQVPNNALLTNYKGYFYNSKADWISDVMNKNHRLAEDSVSMSYDLVYSTPYFLSKKTYAVGSKKIVSVEYYDPKNPIKQMSNWGDLFENKSGIIEIKNSGFNTSSSDNSGTTDLDNYSKKMLVNLTSGKWNLVNIKNSNSTNLALGCRSDDFIQFSLDGSWTYNIGANNCNNTSTNGNGSYNSITNCDSIHYISSWFNTSQGTFNPIASYYRGTELLFEVIVGQNQQTYYFKK